MPEHVDVHGVTVEIERWFPLGLKRRLKSGKWKALTANALEILGEGDRVVEGGAGLGVASVLAAKRADYVAAFEPEPTMLWVSRRTRRLNAVVGLTISPRAIGVENGKARFEVMDHPWRSQFSETGDVEVDVQSIGELMTTIQANALVLDVEGAEHEIICEGDVSRAKKFVIECHTSGIKRDVVRQLKKMGCEVVEHGNDKWDHYVVSAVR
jgi:FkbM family methyltransferase